MRTKNPFFAKNQVKFYCDDTEPKLFPDAFDEYVLKEESDEWQRQHKLEVTARFHAEEAVQDLSKQVKMQNDLLDASILTIDRQLKRIIDLEKKSADSADAGIG